MTNPGDYVFPINEVILETFGAGPQGIQGIPGATGPQGPKGDKGGSDWFISVKDMGAVGDGVADDTAAINLAITAAGAAGLNAVFFPAGTYKVSPDVNGVIIQVRQQNFTMFGAGRSASIIKVANSVPDYIAVISDGVYSGSGFYDLSGFQFHDLCIDENASHNAMADVSFATGPIFNGFPRLAIRLYKGFYGSIWNARFTGCDNINTIAINGGASILGWWNVHHNLFDDHGPGAYHDHSTIYFHGIGISVTDNIFLGSGDAAITAIELHGPNQVVTNNFIKSYFTMMNITGVSAVTSRDINVSHNTGENLGVGIAVWAYDYQSVPGYAIDGCIVSENEVEINYDRWSSVVAYRKGIFLYPNSSGLARGVKIINNIVKYAEHSVALVANDNQSSGISWQRIVASTQAFPQYVQVDLGAATTIDQVVLKLPTTFVTRTQTLTVQGSLAGSVFTDLVASATYTFDPAVSSNSVTIAVASTSTRYVRILISANSTWPSAQLAALEVMNTAVGVTNLAASKTTTSTPYSEAHVSANVTDVSQATYWQGVYTDERDIEIIGNTITGAIGPGIQYAPGVLSKRIKVNDNTITDPGDGCPTPATYAVGIQVNNGTFSTHNIDVSRNRIHDSRYPHIVVKGVDTSLSSVVVQARATDNSVQCADLAQVQVSAHHLSTAWNAGSISGSVHQRFAGGRYYCAPGNARTTLAMTQDVLYLSKFIVGHSRTFDRVGANVTVTPGTTTLRFGVFLDNGFDAPGTLLYDSGTVSAATTGYKEATGLTWPLPGTVVWLGVVAQSGTATITALNMGNYSTGHGTAATLIASDSSGLSCAGPFAGALTSDPAVSNYAAFGPLILLRAV